MDALLTTMQTNMITESWHNEGGWYFILPYNKETKKFYKWCNKNLNYRTEFMPNASSDTDRVGVKVTHQDDAVLVMLTWS